jgi:hypothetical protein
MADPGRAPVYHYPDRLSGVVRRGRLYGGLPKTPIRHSQEAYARHKGHAGLLRERIDRKLGQ